MNSKLNYLKELIKEEIHKILNEENKNITIPTDDRWPEIKVSVLDDRYVFEQNHWLGKVNKIEISYPKQAEEFDNLLNSNKLNGVIESDGEIKGLSLIIRQDFYQIIQNDQRITITNKQHENIIKEI